MKKNKPPIVLAFVCLIFAFLNILHVLTSSLKTPEGTIYLASGLFAADYWGYLSLIAQGYRGNWRLDNLFTSELTKSYRMINWPYLLIGHLSRILKITLQEGYWSAVFVLTAVLVFFAYRLIVRILREKNYLVWPTFLIYLFSGPFWWIKSLTPLAVNYDEVNWYYRTVFFDRISVIVHHLLANLLVIWLFTILEEFFSSVVSKEKGRIVRIFGKIVFLILVIMSLTPIKLTYLSLAFAVGFFLIFVQNKGLRVPKIFGFYSILLFILSLVLFVFGLYMRQDLSGLYFPELKDWERNALEFPPLKQFLSASGPVFLLGIAGFLYLILSKVKLPAVFLAGMTATALSYSLFYTKFSQLFDNHNSRLLFPESYLFLSLSLVLALDFCLVKRKKNSNQLIWLPTVFLILFGLVCWPKAFSDREWPNPNKGFPEYFQYLPEEIADGLAFIEKQPGENKIVLLTPDPGLANLVPIFSQAKVFVARALGTINFVERFVQAKVFYFGGEPLKNKINFLKKEKISHIIWTIYDVPEKDIGKFVQPPFFVSGMPLELVFANSEIRIYAVR